MYKTWIYIYIYIHIHIYIYTHTYSVDNFLKKLRTTEFEGIVDSTCVNLSDHDFVKGTSYNIKGKR